MYTTVYILFHNLGSKKKTESIRRPNTILANRWLESSLKTLSRPLQKLVVALKGNSRTKCSTFSFWGTWKAVCLAIFFVIRSLDQIFKGLLSVKIGGLETKHVSEGAQNVIRAFNFVILFLKLTFSHLKVLRVDSDEGILLGVAAFWQVRTLSFGEYTPP